MQDTFRKIHNPLTSTQMEMMNKIADTAELLLAVYKENPQTREMSLAITNLEQSVMWARKSVTA